MGGFRGESDDSVMMDGFCGESDNLMTVDRFRGESCKSYNSRGNCCAKVTILEELLSEERFHEELSDSVGNRTIL